MPAGKTIYVMGAGASKPSGAPLQSELLPLIMDPAQERDRRPNVAMLATHPAFKAHQATVTDFLQQVFHATPPYPALEDILTVLDRAILRKEPVRTVPYEALPGVRHAFLGCTVLLLQHALMRPTRGAHLKMFTEARVKGRIAGTEDWTILCLNWDIVTDYVLYRLGARKGGFVDYGTPVETYGADEEPPYHANLRFVASENLERTGLASLKILKLHGSLNWLVCKDCDRLYVRMSSKIAGFVFIDVDPALRPRCRSCGAGLQAVVVTPTLVKDFGLGCLQDTWEVAAQEVAEAARVVFLGYSFPQADYEFRHLLARSLPSEAPIDVVLHESDDPRTMAANAQLREPAEARYRAFFGEGRCRFHYEGIDGYARDALERRL